MTLDEFTKHLKEIFETLPRQTRVAARHVLDNPRDVALLSMRELARQADVPPATMTRLARQIGLSGFDELRAIHAMAVRKLPQAYGGRAKGLLEKHRALGVSGVASEMMATLIDHLSALAEPDAMRRLTEAAEDLVGARRIFCLGHRSSFPVAFQFSYLTSYFEDRCILIDPVAGAGRFPPALDMREDDVLLVISFAPSARQVVETTAFVRRQGARVIAITDSDAGPIGRMAHRTIIVGKSSPSFFDTVGVAFAACEVLVALVAGLTEGDVPATVAEREAQAWDLGIWWDGDRPLPPITRAVDTDRRSSGRGRTDGDDGNA